MEVTLEHIIVAGIHLGHHVRTWHPKMAIYTCGIRDGIRLIDLLATQSQLKKAQKLVKDVSRTGKGILFIGTTSQSAQRIKDRALDSESFFVTERWLGGILTNWSTILVSLLKMHRLEHSQREGWRTFSRKESSSLQKRLARLQLYFGGLKGIRSLPGVAIVVGQNTEITAIRECRKLGVPLICRVDTDCDPDLADISVPINDDSVSSICIFLNALVPRIREGRMLRASKKIKRETYFYKR